VKKYLLISIASILTLSVPVYGQNLFEADSGSGTINKFTPGGVQSAFASGLNEPTGLTFNGAGNLFQADYGSGSIYDTRRVEPRALLRPG